tara:strand:+ start:166 stop:480 length:315 start_codon:yes stop_codon:yes gene_type:complete
MCFQTEQTKDAIDRLDSQGKYHPDYDKYPKASWKMKAGEKQHPVIPERTNRGINIFPGIVAGGGPDVVKLGGGAPNPQQYARDKAAARQNTNRTSLSTNDSARG